MPTPTPTVRRHRSALTLADVFDAVQLLQSCDGLPVLSQHVEAQLGLQERWGKEWRRILATRLQRLEREGWLARQVASRRRVRDADGKTLRTERTPAGWVCLVGVGQGQGRAA